jgi:hypothetical protein
MTWITSMLVLSTAHLPEGLRQTLEYAPGLSCDAVTYGYMLWVPEDDAWTDGDETYPDLVKVMEPIFALARASRCTWIKFDCDEAPDEALMDYSEEAM